MKHILKNWVLYLGLLILVLGSGPLFLVILLARFGIIEESNAVGPGILAFFTFWPGVVLVLVGLGLLIYRKVKSKK